MRSVPCPFRAESTCREARDAYLRENGWTLAAYDAKWTEASVLGIKFSVPNTPRHRWAIRLHDLHHVATGYGTDLVGEGEISAWELSRGLGHLDAYVSAIVIGGALSGFLLSPRRIVRAFRQGRARNLFAESDREQDYDELLALSVAQLRERLDVPPAGLDTPRRLHAHAPAAHQVQAA